MVCNFLISNIVEVIFILLHAWHESPEVWSKLSLYLQLYDIKHVAVRLIVQHYFTAAFKQDKAIIWLCNQTYLCTTTLQH